MSGRHPRHAPALASAALTLALSAGVAAAQGGGLQAAAAAAPPPLAARAAEVSARMVEQKAQMLDRLLFSSPVAARVASSQSEDARRHLTHARELFTQGRALAAAGQIAGADALLNQAIAEIGRAQQLVPDQTARLVSERARYQQLSSSVEALLRTYQVGVGGHGAITMKADSTGERSVTQAMAAVEQARVQADDGKVAEANRILDQALSLLLKDALQRMEGQTVVYDRRFASSRDEFAYELARHRSLEGLVPLAVLEFRPSQEARVLIDRYVRQAQALREQSESQAAGADHVNALLTLAQGSAILQRALQAAGLSVPQTMGSQ